MPHSIQREPPEPHRQRNSDPPQVVLVPEVPKQHQIAGVIVALACVDVSGVEAHDEGVKGVRCEYALERVRKQHLQHRGRVHSHGPGWEVAVPPEVRWHVVETRIAKMHGLRHALHGRVHRAPSEQRECRHVVGPNSGEDPVGVLQMHKPRDGDPRAACHAAGCVDSEDAAATRRINDGVQRTLRPCEVECGGAGDNGLLRRGFEEGTKCSGAVGDGWGGEHLPRECGGPEHGKHFGTTSAFCNDLNAGNLFQNVVIIS